MTTPVQAAPVKMGRIRLKRRAAILAAAEQEFACNGFKGTSTSAIAERAGLAKAQVHYYFGSKEDLYQEVLATIMNQWNLTLEDITADDEPAEVLSRYVRAKMHFSRERPELSKIFASEVLRGAPILQTYLGKQQYEWVQSRAAVIRAWVEQGKMRRIDPVQLIIYLWALTQHYADFNTQVLAVMGKDCLTDEEYGELTDQLIDMVLVGCGIATRDTSTHIG
ncbi:TetR family transcriptional regulator [Pokkaliibacter plantistimulans]|uniref:TetR family transcriptional regulator n=1 Tax=Proteobacteria bacterium 228 TaxID=2083153 RepID=A0A2S5KHY0_9PROT|nr:TetR/AcrR family transcriptional regulator [Pokkaliibacter plantistimulans]PPC74380.1 TetR family transcriptional regulator [Pokkaliibacter plantistimulans]